MGIVLRSVRVPPRVSPVRVRESARLCRALCRALCRSSSPVII